MPETHESLEPPTPGKTDLAHAGARAVLGAIPIAGSAATELFQLIFTPPLLRRQQEWMEAVAEKIQRLEESGVLRIENLQDNAEFIDATLHATQAALRTSQADKLDALRNAVLNVAVGQAPEQSLQQMFLSWIDTFTEWHLRILELFDDPAAHIARPDPHARFQAMTSSLDEVLKTAYPKLDNRREFYDQVWADLRSRGLVTTDSLHGMMSPQGVKARRTSELGRLFLAFIRDSASE